MKYLVPLTSILFINVNVINVFLNVQNSLSTVRPLALFVILLSTFNLYSLYQRHRYQRFS